MCQKNYRLLVLTIFKQAFVEPPLTTMAQDFKEMGKLAGEVLLQTMQQDLQIIEDIQVPVTLIERETISTVSK